MKRIISVLLSLIMIFSLASCKASKEKNPSSLGEGGDSAAVSGEMRLLYSASDTLNPYTAQTDLNRKLSLLLFDSLVRVNNNFEAEYLLAESVLLEGKVCT